MLRYTKGKAPPCLAVLQSTPGASWAKSVYGDQRQEIREHLAQDQGELCAYCSRRARPDEASMRIDHYEARSDGGDQFTWKNLIGSCSGLGSDADGTYETCDRVKKAKVMRLLDPREPEPGDPRQFLRFHADGTVHTDDPRATHDVNEVLNLNAPHLTRARRSVLDGLRLWAEHRKPNRSTLQSQLQSYEVLSGVSAREFAPVYVYHLSRWLHRP